MTITLGIIKENKQPVDPRTALSPDMCIEAQKLGFNVLVESSEDRVFSNSAYANKGIKIVEDISIADVLLGVKEVPVEFLIPNKTYLFFSHTIKEQPYNKKMLQAILTKKIELIDYETLTYENERRIIGFGRYAGIVGAYNGILAWGKKYKLFNLKPAYKCRDFEELKQELSVIEIPNMKIVITGGGRVSHGAVEILDNCGIRKLSAQEYLKYDGNKAVYCVLDNGDLFENKDGSNWDNNHFYTNHEDYIMKFAPYIPQTDLMVNGIYWDEDLPIFFTKEETANKDFRIRVIADVTCDPEGSVPITLRPTPIHDPVIGWDYATQKECPPYQENSIDVMAVTNLPAELPADASQGFGESLINDVLPEFFKENSPVLDRARITTKDGELGEDYLYLTDYVS